MCEECGNVCSVCFLPSTYVIDGEAGGQPVEGFACPEHFDQVKEMVAALCRDMRRRAAAAWN